MSFFKCRAPGTGLMRSACTLLVLVSFFCFAPRGNAETPVDEAELAKMLSNPVANLVSVPFQNNWSYGLGTTNATRYNLNVQPVIPFRLDERWNLITRTIVPYFSFDALTPSGSGVGGLGDTAQSLFLSPNEPISGGWILGVGSVLLFPTATSPSTGSGKWSAGPTFVLLRQESGWTYGLLVSQVWSFAGPESRANVNVLFSQPFISFTTRTFTTIGFTTESTYDWTGAAWQVPLSLSLSQILKVGGRPFSVSFGGRYYATTPSGGPHWGIRSTVTLLFPK